MLLPNKMNGVFMQSRKSPNGKAKHDIVLSSVLLLVQSNSQTSQIKKKVSKKLCESFSYTFLHFYKNNRNISDVKT